MISITIHTNINNITIKLNIKECYQVHITRITLDSDHVDKITDIVIMDEFMRIIA